ncbi:MAG: tetratricopeptide repeat protein [Chloroflexota bacterium]
MLQSIPMNNPKISTGDLANNTGVAIGENIQQNINIYQGISIPNTSPEEAAEARARLAQLPIDEIPAVQPLPAGSRLPLSSNPHFVGRETGLGGIGKTQLAVTFAHRYGQYFAGGVYWVSMADAASVRSEVVQCGLHMADVGSEVGPEFANLDIETQVRRVLGLWQRDLPRLLIFDNCEDPALLDQWRPPSGGCRILVTSRRQQWNAARGMMTLPLTTLTREQSVALLLKFRGLDISSPYEHRDTLDAIAEELGDLPLALHLAGSYLQAYQHDIQPEDYLHELRHYAILAHESLQAEALGPADHYSPTQHDLHVGRTFDLSWRKLDSATKVDNLAQKLLARAAFFAPNEPIPRKLLLATVDDDTLSAVQKSRALQRLVALGLLDEGDDGALLMHRLVMHFVQGVRLDEKAQGDVDQTLSHEARNLNNAGFPRVLLAWQNHLRHITTQAISRYDEQSINLCNNLGYHLDSMGDYEGAHPYYEQALAISQNVQGEKHPDTACCLNNLGSLLHSMGDYEAFRGRY